MKRVLTLAVVLLALGALAAPVAATSHESGTPTTKKDCEEAGGTWLSNRGEKSCIIVTQVSLGQLEVREPPEDLPWDPETTIGINATSKRMQRGTIGAPGTSATYRETVECRSVDLYGRDKHEVVFTGEICDLIYRQVTTDDEDRS